MRFNPKRAGFIFQTKTKRNLFLYDNIYIYFFFFTVLFDRLNIGIEHERNAEYCSLYPIKYRKKYGAVFSTLQSIFLLEKLFFLIYVLSNLII